jgi:hypothetical protein
MLGISLSLLIRAWQMRESGLTSTWALPSSGTHPGCAERVYPSMSRTSDILYALSGLHLIIVFFDLCSYLLPDTPFVFACILDYISFTCYDAD